MVIPPSQQVKKDILIWIFKEILALEDNSNLYKACENDGITSMEALLCLNGTEEIDDLTYFDGTNKVKINNYDQGTIHALQHLWFNRALTLDPIARDWRNLSKEQFNNYRTSPEFQAMFPALLEPEPVPMIVPTPITAMITPVEQAIILKHVLENVLEEDPGSPLACALEQHGCQSIQDVMALSPWEIESLKWKDGSSPTSILPRGPRNRLVTFQAFVLSLHPNPSSIVTNDWLSLTSGQCSTFRRSAEYMCLRQHSPRPVPPHDDSTNGEQYKNWGALGEIESFDVEEFQAAMVHASETFGSSEEEEEFEETTTNNNSIELLNDTIMFFESFCLEDDFELHSLDELHVTSEEFEYVPLNDNPSPTNKEAHEPNHAPAMEDTTVHIEYPDRTKFVASMNHEQYEELIDWYADY
jgi:hypothetical protein